MRRTSANRLSLLGSLLLAAAGCATQTDPTPEPDPDPEPGVISERECEGVEIDDSALAGDVAFDATDGVATVTVHNRTGEDQTIEVTLHTQSTGGALITEVAPPVVLVAGASGSVRIAVGDVDGDGRGLKAELVIRGLYGQITQRRFVHGRAGRSIADTAAARGIALYSTIEGEPVQLGGFVPGGRGLDATALLAANDTIDDLANPVLPLTSLSFNMCFRWPVTLIDAGFGEDYGVDPTSPWVARGGRVKITQAGDTLFDSWLDASGCTGTFVANATTGFTIYGYSRARVAGNELVIRDAGGMMRSFVINDASPASNTPTFVFPEVPAVSTMLAVSAYTVQKLHGGVTNQVIPIENRCQPNGCCNCASGGSIWVTSPNRKFLIAHEIGHTILSLAIGGYNNDVSFDLVPGNVAGVCDTTSSHSMWSMENQSGAAMEGWAHFVAATAFNNTASTNPGATMRYWSAGGDTTIDIEEGATGGASNYFETVCPGVASATKMAVQLDWLRHWWDYSTNDTDGDPGMRPSFTRMMEELDAAPLWSAGTAWTRMRSGVQSRSGADQLARWDQMGAWNGID